MEFKRTEEQPSYLRNGCSRPCQVEDENGKTFIFKSSHRSNQEFAALSFSRLLGFRTPEFSRYKLNQVEGIVQEYMPNTSTLAHILDYNPTTAIENKHWIGLAEQSVLDWMLVNSDVHRNNFIILNDGSIMGIDKEYSWNSYQWVESHSVEHIINSQTYGYLNSHVIQNFSEQDFESLVNAVFKTIERVENLATYEILESVFALAYNRDELIDSHIEFAEQQRDCLRESFRNFYRDEILGRMKYDREDVSTARMLESLDRAFRQAPTYVEA